MPDFAPEGGETFEVDGEDCGGLVDREAFFGDDAAFTSGLAGTARLVSFSGGGKVKE